MADDEIHIEALELRARIGVPDSERANAQRLTVSLTITPLRDFRQLNDDVAPTVDYAAACERIKEFVASRADKLIETLANGIASDLLRAFPIARVRVELRKFILPDTQYTAVTVTRENHDVAR